MFGLGAQYYSHIYIWLVALLSLFVFSPYASYSRLRLVKSKKGFSLEVFLLMLFMVLFIGLRPISGKYFVDMAGYNEVYHALANPNYKITWNTTNKIFGLLR